MKNDFSKPLSKSQFIFTIVGIIIGIGVLSLPNSLVKYAKEDAWISAGAGAIYPIFIVILTYLISKRYPNENIIQLTKRFFGNFFGTILNFIFLAQFLIVGIAVAAGINNVYIVFIVSFLTPLKILGTVVAVGAYTAYKGIRSLGRLNKIFFYISVILIIIPLVALGEGNILNVMPFFKTPIKDIVNASISSAYSYAGIEIILLIYPLIEDKKKILSSGLIAVFICMAIYIWFTFITIYYLGADVIEKGTWSFLFIYESIKIPVVTSFLYVFMFIWSGVVLRCYSNVFYCAATVFEDLFNFIDKKYIFVILSVIVLFASLKFYNYAIWNEFLSGIIPKITIFNILLTVAITIMTYLTKDD